MALPYVQGGIVYEIGTRLEAQDYLGLWQVSKSLAPTFNLNNVSEPLKFTFHFQWNYTYSYALHVF